MVRIWSWTGPAAALALLPGCANRPAVDCQGSFRVDPASGFNPEHVAIFEQAAARWNAFAGQPYFRIEEGGRCPIVATSVERTDWAAFEHETGTLKVERASFFGDELDDDRWEAIIMHEMGHSAGLGHLARGQAGLMSDSGWEFFRTDFTEADRSECIWAGLCPRP